MSDQMLMVCEPTTQKKLSQASRTLELLEVGPRTTIELFAVGPRPAAYVRQLRLMGYIIHSEITGKVATYSLLGQVEMVEVTDAMQSRYYETEHWKRTRRSRLDFDACACRLCGSAHELQVHHWRYDLFAEQLCDLLTVCRTCHLQLHSYENVHCHFPRYVLPEIAERLY